jgi:hypothetical protein
MLNSFLFYATMFVVFGPVKFRQSGPKVGPRLKLELKILAVVHLRCFRPGTWKILFKFTYVITTEEAMDKRQ